MKRIDELESKLDELSFNKTGASKEDLLVSLYHVIDFLDQMNEIKSNGQVRKQTRKLIYKLHNRLVVNNES